MTTDAVELDTPEEAAPDDMALALMRNDLRGMSKDQRAAVIRALIDRMGVDPALAPIDLIVDKQSGALRPYINARGAAELAKRNDLSDDVLDVDIRPESGVVIVQMTMSDPSGRRTRDVGAAAFKPDWPDSIANAIKKAATSAHRRTTLRMVGIFISEAPGADDAS